MLCNKVLSQTEQMTAVALHDQQFEVWSNAHWDEISGGITFYNVARQQFFFAHFGHSINLIASTRARCASALERNTRKCFGEEGKKSQKKECMNRTEWRKIVIFNR